MATLVSGAPLSLPALPTTPPVYDASKGGAAVPTLTDPSTAATKAFIQQQVAAIPATYQAQKLGAGARAVQGLAGMGGYNVDAAGNLTYDASKAGTGQAERQAVQGTRASANAAGTLYSSFTDTGISNALGKLSQQAQGVVNQYASDLAGYLQGASTNFTSLYGQWAQALGQDASFALQNPPTGIAAPAPAAAPPTPVVSALGQRYGASYGAAGSSPQSQQNVIQSFIKSHYSPKLAAPKLQQARSSPAYAASVYNTAVR